MRLRLAIVLAVMTLAACGSGERSNAPMVTEVDVPNGLTPPLVAIGEALVVRSGDTVARSSDGGMTWNDVSLPGAPATVTLDFHTPVAFGDLAAVGGHDVATGSYVWVSDDGISWRGGALISGTTEPAVVGLVGDLLVAAGVGADGLEVRVSHDRGDTWMPADTPPVDAPPGSSERAIGVRADVAGVAVEVITTDEQNAPTATIVLTSMDGETWDATRCSGTACLARAGGEALVRGADVSLDGGVSWHPFTLDPPAPASQDVPGLVAAVETGGGRFLGVAQSDVPSDVTFGYLAVKTSSGAGPWHQLVNRDACEGKVETRPNSRFSLPVQLGDLWLSTSTCVDLIDAVDAVVVGGRADDTEFLPVAGTLRRDVRFDQPVALGDDVVVPIVDDGYHLVGLLRLSATE